MKIQLKNIQNYLLKEFVNDYNFIFNPNYTKGRVHQSIERFLTNVEMSSKILKNCEFSNKFENIYACQFEEYNKKIKKIVSKCYPNGNIDFDTSYTNIACLINLNNFFKDNINFLESEINNEIDFNFINFFKDLKPFIENIQKYAKKDENYHTSIQILTFYSKALIKTIEQINCDDIHIQILFDNIKSNLNVLEDVFSETYKPEFNLTTASNSIRIFNNIFSKIEANIDSIANYKNSINFYEELNDEYIKDNEVKEMDTENTKIKEKKSVDISKLL